MPVEQQLHAAPRRRPATGRLARRAADRHYLAVVAAEARRLARQLRPADPARGTAIRPSRGDARAEPLH